VTDGTMIGEDDFTKSISHLPLVSIDLLVQNSEKSILLGKRGNRPARGHWFVPGGRIRRMERFDSAFQRITNGELGEEFDLRDAKFHGVFQHMYDDSAFSEKVGSHYVSIAMGLEIRNLELTNLPQIQHKEYRWFDLKEIIDDEEVHDRTKDYFQRDIGIRPQ
jgi:colanic acid biosynthesis protein WcaH